MADKLILKAGSRISSETILYEEYQKEDNQIIANVSIDKIEDVFQHFIAIHDEPLFFVLELPAKFDDETEAAPHVVNTLHKDVYYMDGCTQEEALTILSRAGNILYNDGLSSFGFGGHESNDEILFGKYNVLTLYSTDIDKYDDFFEPHEIGETERIITAWDTFSENTPGTSERYEMEGKTVFDIPKMFGEWGIYLAEQREDK